MQTSLNSGFSIKQICGQQWIINLGLPEHRNFSFQRKLCQSISKNNEHLHTAEHPHDLAFVLEWLFL